MSAGSVPVAWQTKPCPSWCATLHDDADDPSARMCSGEGGVTGLTYESPLDVGAAEGSGYALDTMHVYVELPFGAVPQITMTRGTGACVTMSLHEARQHAEQILARVAQGEATLAGQCSGVAS